VCLARPGLSGTQVAELQRQRAAVAVRAQQAEDAAVAAEARAMAAAVTLATQEATLAQRVQVDCN
jgi:hypothetical protein